MCLCVTIILGWVFSTVRHELFNSLRFMLSFSAVPTIRSMNLFLCWIVFVLPLFPPFKKPSEKKMKMEIEIGIFIRYKKQWPSRSSLESFMPCLPWWCRDGTQINLKFAEWWGKNCQTIQRYNFRFQNNCYCISILRMLLCIYSPPFYVWVRELHFIPLLSSHILIHAFIHSIVCSFDWFDFVWMYCK